MTLGTKDFTEEYILGQLYAQALAAEGFTVHLKQGIGPTEVIDPGLHLRPAGVRHLAHL